MVENQACLEVEGLTDELRTMDWFAHAARMALPNRKKFPTQKIPLGIIL